MAKDKCSSGLLGMYLRCRRARILTVEPAIILFLLGRQFLLALLQHLFFAVLADRYLQQQENDWSNFTSPSSQCLSSSSLNNYSEGIYRRVLSESNALVAYTQAAQGPAAVVLTLALMPLLDQYGYRMGLILPAVGNVVKGISLYLLIFYQMDPRWIPAISFVCSASGEVVLFVSTSFAYISHVSKTESVTMRIALGEAAACFGEATGMFLAGFLLQVSNCNFAVLLLFFIIVNLGAIIYSLLFLPEALDDKQREYYSEEKKSCNIFCELRHIFSKSFSRTWRLLILLAYIAVSFIMPYGNSLILLYFLKALPFDFSAFRIGVVQSVISYGRAIYNIVLAVLSSVVVLPDLGIVLVSLLVSLSCSAIYGLATADWEIYTVSVLYGMDILGWVGAEAYMSKLLSQKEQGTLFALVISIQGLSNVCASLGWPFAMAMAVREELSLGLPFFFTAILGLAFFPFIIVLLVCDLKKEKCHKVTSLQSNGVSKLIQSEDKESSRNSESD